MRGRHARACANTFFRCHSVALVVSMSEAKSSSISSLMYRAPRAHRMDISTRRPPQPGTHHTSHCHCDPSAHAQPEERSPRMGSPLCGWPARLTRRPFAAGWLQKLLGHAEVGVGSPSCRQRHAPAALAGPWSEAVLRSPRPEGSAERAMALNGKRYGLSELSLMWQSAARPAALG